MDAAEAGPRLDGALYMDEKWACWIIYLLCITAIVYAGVQTILINRMNMDPSKVKVATA